MTASSVTSCVTFEIKKRKIWKIQDVQRAVAKLRTSTLHVTAKELNVSAHSLRFALRRRGFDVRFLRAKSIDGQTRLKSSVWPLNSFPSLPIEAPIIAMEAIERKPEHGCSWPIGDLAEGNFRFCGRPRARRKSYCAICAQHANR